MNKLLNLRLDLDEAITYGNTEKAKKLARDGLTLAHKEENLGEMEYFRGQIEILNENYKKAIEHFDKAVIYNPKDGASYNDRALCMIELGDIKDASGYFDKGIEVEPDFATVYHNKGWLLSRIGNYKEAIDYLRKALELDPDRAVTYENLADIYLNLDDTKLALEYYNKAIDLIKPQYPYIKRQLQQRIKELNNEKGSNIF